MATRWGICGAGRISHDFMVALQTLPAENHQAVAVASRDSSRARNFAERHQIPKSYGSYEELATDPSVDIVYVGIINPEHLRVALLMLRAGRNVLCEKPMAMNLQEVRQLVSAARNNDCFLMEATLENACPKIRGRIPVIAEVFAKRKGTVLPGQGQQAYGNITTQIFSKPHTILIWTYIFIVTGPKSWNALHISTVVVPKLHRLQQLKGLWTRFFPVSNAIRGLLSQNDLGEIKMVKAEFGTCMLQTPRLVEKELGGGVLLDIGCYCLQFVCMVFSGEKPESVQATGFLTEKGVDEAVTIVLKYSRKRMALVTVTMAIQLANQATINGTKGTITVPGFMWCPTSLVVNGKRQEFPLPAPSQPLNFTNSTGLRYEAEQVRQCLQKGLKECPDLPLAESELIMSILDEARRQVGVVYDQDTA